MPRLFVFAALVSALVILGAGLALAQDQTNAKPDITITPDMITPDMRKAAEGLKDDCAADVSKFCHWTLPGGGRIAKCLVKNLDEVSPTCRDKITALLAQSGKAE